MVDDVGKWLQTLGLGQHAELFKRHAIDGEVLATLTSDDLKDLDLPLGHRKKLLAAISAFQSPGGVPDSYAGERAHGAAREAAPAPAQRRQLTVMFCDLVDSTALTQTLDPEALRELMRNYQQVCAGVTGKYDGHVAQYLGDGLMVYFGWPRAHEDDAERAVRCALEIVGAVKAVPARSPLRVRIGIASGPVVVGETGEGDASVPKVAVGETPNIAARMQGLASEDEIVIAPSTHRLAASAFDYDDLGEHALKGVVGPVRAWRVRGVGRAEDRFEAAHGGRTLTPLVGREEEVAMLQRRWRQAQAAEGQVLLMCGEPGIGKSRLTRVLRELVAGSSHALLQYQCSPFHQHSALYPAIEQLERAARFTREDAPEARLDKLEAVLAGSLEQKTRTAALFAALLSLPIHRYPPLQLSPQKQKELTLEAFVGQVEALAREQPVLMIFEDAHWIDPTTHEALDLLVRRLHSARVLLLITYRPEYVPAWGGQPHVTSLMLNRLGRRQVTEVVGGLSAGRPLPDEVLEQILEHTDGVPLFVEELTKTVLESGLLREGDGAFHLAGPLPPFAIPATLQDSLMARLDRLGAVREVAQIGACIGRQFSHGLIAAVSPIRGERLDQALNQLVQAELLFQRGNPPDAIYTFKHALVQDVAYDSLLRSSRQQIHAWIAQAIEAQDPSVLDTVPELLAHHYTGAGLLDAAIPRWRKAGERALKRVALQESIAHLNRGLDLCAKLAPSTERDDLELSLRSLLVPAWIALRSWATPEVREHAEPMVRLARALDKPEPLLTGLWGLWVNTMAQGRVAESLDLVQRLRSEAQAIDSADLRTCAETAATISHYYLGQFVTASEHGERVQGLYDEERFRRLTQVVANDPRTAVGVHASLFTWMLGYPDQAVRICDETIAHARTRGHPYNLSWALTTGAGVFDYRNEPERLLERGVEAERLGGEHAMWYVLEVFCPWTRGLALLRAGRAGEATELLQAVVARKAKTSSHILVPYLKSALAEGLALEGDQDGALAVVAEALEQIQRPGWQERAHLAEILRLKGWLLMRQNRTEEAERELRASIAVAREQRAKSWELRTSTTLARLLAERSERRAAHDLLAPVYGWFTEGLDTHDLEAARTLLDQLR
jgi:class 3 adenylate cyclase/tetratricopeptide (TPR) repeat protein